MRCILALLALPAVACFAETGGPATADEIVARVNAVPGGQYVTRNMELRMIDRHGKTRTRKTVNYRRDFEDQKRTVLFFQSPANVKGTAFLIWDYADNAVDDDQWLYLPVLRKSKRISSADRGDYFLGTDFSYEDMKLDGKLNPLDYHFSLAGEENEQGKVFYLIEAETRDAKTSEELGYSRTRFKVDGSNWMVVSTDFWDTKGNALKSLIVSDIRPVDDIQTRHSLTMTNHQTGHRTELIFSNVDYRTPVRESLFTRQALARGH